MGLIAKKRAAERVDSEPARQLVAVIAALQELSEIPDIGGVPYFVWEPSEPLHALSADTPIEPAVQRRIIPGDQVMGIFQAIEQRAEQLAPYAVEVIRKAGRYDPVVDAHRRLQAENQEHQDNIAAMRDMLRTQFGVDWYDGWQAGMRHLAPDANASHDWWAGYGNAKRRRRA